MSDGVITVPTGASDSAGHSQLHSAGSMLRAAREAAGLHVAALAVSMKVPVKKLEALESDRLDLLPDMVFVRALASSVCRTLKIDPAPVLEKLPSSTKPQLVSADRDINTPFDAYGSSTALTLSGALRKPVLLAALLLVAAGAVFFFPASQRHPITQEVETSPSQVFADGTQPPLAVAASQDGSVPLAKTVGVPEGSLPPPGLQTGEATAPVVEKNQESAPTAVVSTPVAPSINMPAQMTTATEVAAESAPLTDILVLKARAPSWVKVVDAKGSVQLLKVVAAGESVRVGGVAPLSVVIGAVDAVSLEVRGKPFSVVDIAKDNVARFEVK